ncbi:Solute carrier family 40 member 1 [Wickerhamomyces ciferrii]|uniref:Solute carrier family 40 member n=1 Tax=Wickerhamomyces ciferrii (strain ATCC 14091 / BCRC 22168 / CBS 111 / JCM 3599 / NBRC 0793 / NRRL Y-1031 F-60-10) TaxID=1206466 RepID=K0KSP0_WICCF|nr:Solute carrier family 40 member 1 [Wickerhamomyces ciferrii]CCH46176.1 Solute carrier family 40 member 1 [Wickerhamomyces ciferrii]
MSSTRSSPSSLPSSNSFIDHDISSEDHETDSLLNSTTKQLNHDSIQDIQNDHQLLSPELKSLIKKRLYISHFLYVWNSRMYEFGIGLFIINLFPGTLFPSSLFAFCSSLSGILLTPFVTKLANHGERLKFIKETIFIQRSFAILSSLVLLIVFQFFDNHKIFKRSCLAIVIICGIVERLTTIANKISISRDWIVKICHNDEDFLIELNTKLRSIDLFCKLVAPFFISSFITFTGFKITLIFIILVFLISNQIEFNMILKLYHSVDSLNESQDIISAKNSKSHLRNNLSYWGNLKLFIKNPFSLLILSISCVYLTVLSFGNSTIAYLLTFDDINNLTIGFLKGVSTAFELFGTLLIFPFLSKALSVINVGFIAVIFQLLSLIPILFSFIWEYSKTHWLICFCIPWSRIGLWCFDLAVQNSIQIHIHDEFERFNVTTFEESLNNFFELSSQILTMIFHKPEQFKYSVYASIGAVAVAVGFYTIFVVKLHFQAFKTSGEA